MNDEIKREIERCERELSALLPDGIVVEFDATPIVVSDFSRIGAPMDTPLCFSLPPAAPERSSRSGDDE
jgi:hypothetical protein